MAIASTSDNIALKFSINSSASCLKICGPFSKISVCCPSCKIAIQLRVFPEILVNRLSMPSPFKFSTISAPKISSANPVAKTSAPSSFSTRDTLSPLPPAVLPTCATRLTVFK